MAQLDIKPGVVLKRIGELIRPADQMLNMIYDCDLVVTARESGSGICKVLVDNDRTYTVVVSMLTDEHFRIIGTRELPSS